MPFYTITLYHKPLKKQPMKNVTFSFNEIRKKSVEKTIFFKNILNNSLKNYQKRINVINVIFINNKININSMQYINILPLNKKIRRKIQGFHLNINTLRPLTTIKIHSTVMFHLNIQSTVMFHRNIFFQKCQLIGMYFL